MSEWVDNGEICETCGYTGPHLHVDGGALRYCGRCDSAL